MKLAEEPSFYKMSRCKEQPLITLSHHASALSFVLLGVLMASHREGSEGETSSAWEFWRETLCASSNNTQYYCNNISAQRQPGPQPWAWARDPRGTKSGLNPGCSRKTDKTPLCLIAEKSNLPMQFADKNTGRPRAMVNLYQDPSIYYYGNNTKEFKPSYHCLAEDAILCVDKEYQNTHATNEMRRTVVENTQFMWKFRWKHEK